jgi:hypothetical protein
LGIFVISGFQVGGPLLLIYSPFIRSHSDTLSVENEATQARQQTASLEAAFDPT